MKLTSLAVLSLLAALSSLVFAADYIVDRVNKEDAAASEFFFDSGKGLFWQPGAGGTMGSSAAVDAFIEVWKANAAAHNNDVSDMSFLGEWGTVGTTKGTVNQAGIDKARTNGISATAVQLLVGSTSGAGKGQLTADGADCWAHASSNVLQYWQSYYGVFSSNKNNLQLGYAVKDKQTAVDLLGTQSLKLTKWFYQASPNNGGVVKSAMQSYLTENAYLYQSANTFGDYYLYPSQRNTSANETKVVNGTGASLIEKLTNLVLSSLDCTINEKGDIVRNSYGLISEFTLSHADALSASHSLTLYGFGIDDETHLITKLYYADSDDQQYGIRVYYVKSGTYNQVERLFLYDDEACTELRGYSYVSSLTSIRTADDLKLKGLQYWNGDLEWSGTGENGSTWKQGAGMGSNAVALPDGKTGWRVLVDGKYYDSYFDENRNISFKDAGDVTVEGRIRAGAIKISSGVTKFLAAGADSSIDGTGNVTISDGASLEACLNLGERAVSVEGSGTFTYATKGAVKLAGLSVADGASATFKNGGKYEVACDSTMGTISVQESSQLTLTASDSDVIQLAGLTISEGSKLKSSGIKVTGAFRTRASEDVAQVASAAVLLLGDAVGTTATTNPVASLTADTDLSEVSSLNMETTVDLGGKRLTLWSGTKELTLSDSMFELQTDGTYKVTLFTNIGTLTGLDSDFVLADTNFTTQQGWLSDGVTLSKVSTDNSVSLVLANIQYIPEPTTATLALLGLMGLCARRRRQKSASSN